MQTRFWLVLGSLASCGAAQLLIACSSPKRNLGTCGQGAGCAGASGASGEAGEAGEGGTNAAAGKNSGGRAGSNVGSSGAAGSSGSSGTSGAPGNEAGAAGTTSSAAGTTSSAKCSTDADCSDHLACTGAETCTAGACQAGVPPCANPEPAHCDSVCAEANGAASCTVRGQDNDHDGHFSAACMTNPGDDCDDTAATVYAGAPEVCDGLDNNCNKLIDWADGLGVGGKTIAIGPTATTRFMPAIAWATDKSRYGVVYGDSTSSTAVDLYLEEFDKTGASVLARQPINAAPGTQGVNLTWGSDSFGVTWYTTDAVKFRSIAGNGTPVTGIVDVPKGTAYLVGDGPDVARVGAGNWAVTYTTYDFNGNYTRPLNSVSTAGVASSPIIAANFGGVARIAASSTNFLAFDGSGGKLYSSALVPGTTVVGLQSTTSIFASNQTGFLIAASGATATDLPRFLLTKADGSTSCGPVTFADKSFFPGSAVATPTGYLIASTGDVRVQEVKSDCSLGQLFEVAPGPAGRVRIAGSAIGYGIVWQEGANGPKGRFFGPRYCDTLTP